MDIWFVIFSIGLAQGLFLIIALLALRGKQMISIHLLVILMFCFLSLILAEWLKTFLTIEQIPFTYRTGETIPLLIGPLFLIYMMSVVKPNFSFDKRLLLHFLPFVFFLLLFLPFYLKSNEFKIERIKSLDNTSAPFGLVLFSIFKGVHTAVYFSVSWFYVKKYSVTGKVKPWFNTKLLMRLIALQLIAILLIYAIVVLENFLPEIGIESDRIASILVTISFFILAFAIILYPDSMIPGESSKSRKIKYASSSLKKDNKELLLIALQKKLENEKSYLNAELTINELSEKLGVNSNQLSQVINELSGKNFQQFINEYRVDEVKRNISDSTRTLLGIALDSGFNSKSAFNRIFKEITGKTPSAYKKSL